MKVVLDTNVLISAIIATGVPHTVLLAGFQGEYRLIQTPDTLMEFHQTLEKYPDRFGLDEDAIRTEVDLVSYFAEFVTPTEEITYVDADPDDDKFLEAAVAGDADFLVTGDTHLLDIHLFRAVDIVTAREFHDAYLLG